MLGKQDNCQVAVSVTLADGCVADETGHLVFLSIWARDTAVQEFLARLTLGRTEIFGRRIRRRDQASESVKATFVATMNGASFLPLDEVGNSWKVTALDVFDNPDDVLEAAHPDGRSTHPIPLEPEQASRLLSQLLLAPERVITITSTWPLELDPPG